MTEVLDALEGAHRRLEAQRVQLAKANLDMRHWRDRAEEMEELLRTLLLDEAARRALGDQPRFEKQHAKHWQDAFDYFEGEPI